MTEETPESLTTRLLAGATISLRALVALVASVAVVWSFVSPVGIWAVALGALIAVALSGPLARSAWRGTVLASGLVLVVGVALGVAWMTTRFGGLPRLIGPGRALGLAVLLRYGALTFGAILGLRLLAIRVPRLAPVELIAVVGAFVTAFTAHRDGVVVRPLWFSDWAWRQGLDPGNALVAIGVIASVTLLVLLLLESRERMSVATWVALPVVALIAGLFLSVEGVPDPPPGNNLGLTESAPGDPPQVQMPPGDHGPGGSDGQDESEAGQDDGQGGQQPEDQQGQGGADQEQADQEQGQSDQQFDGQPPPPNQEPVPMAVVILENDYEPLEGAYYFRQEIWSEYTGRRLVATRDRRFDTDVLTRHVVRETEVAPPPEEGRQEVRARVAMLTDHNAPFALASAVSFAPSQNPDPSRFRRAYRFTSLARSEGYAELLGRTSGDDLTPDELAYYTVVPEDPRYGELTYEILEALTPEQVVDPLARALQIKLYLDEHLIYSTRHRHAGATHPTADFLFGDRTGYCVHFAHAAVFLFRSAGIPARVGSGYMVPAENRQGSSIVLTSSNAHAWPEIYIDGRGWVVLDISAEQILDEPLPPVDPELSQLLAEMARDVPPDPDDLGVTDEGGVSLAAVLLWILKLLVAGVFVWIYGRKLWRRGAVRLGAPSALPRSGYVLALDLLAEAGVRRTYGESREAFARRIAERVPSFERATQLHVASALSARPDALQGDAYQRATWQEITRAVRREVSAGVPFWRRAAGALNPVTTFLVR